MFAGRQREAPRDAEDRRSKERALARKERKGGGRRRDRASYARSRREKRIGKSFPLHVGLADPYHAIAYQTGEVRSSAVACRLVRV